MAVVVYFFVDIIGLYLQLIIQIGKIYSLWKNTKRNMERYFAKLDDSRYDVLIGKGFTFEYKTKDFNYKKFPNDIEKKLNKNGLNEIRKNTFFKAIVEDENEFSSNESKNYRKNGLNKNIEYIFSTNLLPDFNFILQKDDMPTNFIKGEGGDQYKTSYSGCAEIEKYRFCYKN